MTTELNKIEGFDPSSYARTITDSDGQQSLYLDVQYRKMWFRLCNPTGKIVKKICNFDGNLAVVEARVYLDRNDPPENFVSNAFAQRFIDPSNQDYGSRYLESAETAAVGRALADAGYGLQFCLSPDPTPVDMGQQFFGQSEMMPDEIGSMTETSVQNYGQPAPVTTDIYDVADQLGLELKRQHPKSSDYNCPFCDGKGKLNLNVEHNVFRCNRCGEYGGMIDLFCKLTGTSDRKTAYRLLAEHNGYSVTQRQVRKKTVSSIKEAEKADTETLHKCYSALLNALTLCPSHKRNLIARGLSEEQIKSNMYRSVPRGEYDNIVYRLLEQNLNLIGVPGFYVSDEGEIKINLHQCTVGFFVPVFDECGYIQGMQIRLDSPFESKRKYIWLSSSEKNGGCSSGSPVQISGNIFDSEVIYVTEGPLKGQIAHHLCGKTFLSVAGVNQQKELDSLFLRIRNEGKCNTIVDAFNMDDDKNEHVLRGHRNLAWLATK